MRYLWGTDFEHRPAVEQYPDVISAKTSGDLFPKSKGFLENDLDKCTGCGDCIEACSVGALSMRSHILASGLVQVEEFRIDLARCYQCSICVEICPVSSLSYSKNFELAPSSSDQLMKRFIPGAGSQHGSKERVGLRKIRAYEVRK